MSEKEMVEKGFKYCCNCFYFREDFTTDLQRKVRVCIKDRSLLGVKTLHFGKCFEVYKNGFCQFWQERIFNN